MAIVVPSKRPRPRPLAVTAVAASTTAAHTALDSSAGLSYVQPSTTSAVQVSRVGINGVKDERVLSPDLEALLAQPSSAGANGSEAPALSQGSMPATAGPSASANQGAALHNNIDDDDTEFFMRSRRKRRAGPKASTAAKHGGMGAFNDLDDLPDLSELQSAQPGEQFGSQFSEESEDDGKDSSDSDGSNYGSSPKRQRRTKASADHSRARKDKRPELPEWTKQKNTKRDSSSPARSAIVVDDSDLDEDAGASRKAKGKKKAENAEREKERLSLTPPPDERLYNKSEWVSYIRQAVHGSEGPQQIDDDDDAILAQLREQQDDDFQISAVNLNPKLARFVPGSSAARSRPQPRRGGQPNRSQSSTTADGGLGEKCADSDRRSGATGAPNGSNADAGSSRAATGPGRADQEPISIDGSSSPIVASRGAGRAQAAHESDGDSDDSVQILSRPPPAAATKKRDSADRSGSSLAEPAVRHPVPDDDDDDFAIAGLTKASTSAARAAALGDGDDDGDRPYAPSSSQIESIHAEGAQQGDDAEASGGAGATAGGGGGGGPGDISVDLRPQTPIVEKIGVKVHGKKDLKLRLRLLPTTKIQTIITAVTERAKKKGILEEGQTVKIVFDGEVLDPASTIADTDVEEDDQFEATW
ncbi:hypothetical protein V8E36_005401 [Tilletia maclaganii]